MTKTHMNKIKMTRDDKGKKLPIRNDGNYMRNSKGIKKKQARNTLRGNKIDRIFLRGKGMMKITSSNSGCIKKNKLETP